MPRKKKKSRIYPEVLITRVKDGDTFVCDIDVGFYITLHDIVIRLYGIDTPEKNGVTKEEGLRVKAYVKELIEGKTVKLEVLKKGKYAGRWIGNVTVPFKTHDKEFELNLCQHLIDNDMGKAYFGGKRG